MKGIVGKKLGMTQVFDEETGQVTPVTVIEAGPCPVVSVKEAAVDGYDAVQVAYGEVAEHRLSKPKLGHLKKNGVTPHRHLLELRGLTGATEGESVTVESFEPGDRVKVSGVSIGKGFAGTIKRHNFSRGPTSHGSHNVRKPGSVGASATPSRVFKGVKMAGRARAGSTRAPHWTGGGAAFAVRTSFGGKVNRKERKAAFRAALSAHADEGTFGVLADDAFDGPSTKEAAALVETWGKQRPLIVVAHEDQEQIVKSFRNLDGVQVVTPPEVEISALVWARSLLVSEAALELVQGRAQS